MNRTNIEWTDLTWNPLRGCSRVSEGCRNCYAEKVAYRFSGAGSAYEGLAVLKNGHASWTGKVEIVEKHLLDPLKWRAGAPLYDADGKCIGHDPGRPLRIFVNSMSDLFHENVPEEWIARIVAVMIRAHRHIYQVLTKRPERMATLLASEAFWQLVDAELERTEGDDFEYCPPLPHIWWGTSVEDQESADKRIPLLLKTPAAVRFISAEPLLGPVQLLWRHDGWGGDDEPPLMDGIPSPEQMANPHFLRHGASRVDWVIVGGESGPGARPMDIAWVRNLVAQCRESATPIFVKQMGWCPRDALFPFDSPNYPGDRPGGWTCRGHWRSATDAKGGPVLYDKKGGNPEEWPRDLRVRQFPTISAA